MIKRLVGLLILSGLAMIVGLAFLDQEARNAIPMIEVTDYGHLVRTEHCIDVDGQKQCGTLTDKALLRSDVFNHMLIGRAAAGDRLSLIVEATHTRVLKKYCINGVCRTVQTCYLLLPCWQQWQQHFLLPDFNFFGVREE